MPFLKTVLLSLFVLGLSFAGSLFLYQITTAYVWPTQPPPLGSLALPLNVSSTYQEKQGPLGASQFIDTDNTTYLIDPSGGSTSKLGGTLCLGNGRGTNTSDICGSSSIQGKNLIKNVLDPIDSQDAATKKFVDDTKNALINDPVMIKVVVGEKHSCALYSNGIIKCWGYNGYGQLGVGDNLKRLVPTQVKNITNAVDLAAGSMHTCAILATGLVNCWGYNGWGEIGTGNNGSIIVYNIPTLVINLTDAVSIAAGLDHSCAAIDDGTVKCWGFNGGGEVGSNDCATFPEHDSPTPVYQLTNVFFVSSSAGEDHTCALVAGGVVKCWGVNGNGQLGNGLTGYSCKPVAVTGLTKVMAVTTGQRHTCAVLSNRTAKCWGLNSNGQLGDGTTTQRLTPVVVKDGYDGSGTSNLTLSSVVGLSGGYTHTCALLFDRTATCWGDNTFGQLGDNTTTDKILANMKKVANFNNGAWISAGYSHSCALLYNGNAKCWGSNAYGQLGNNSTTNSLVPVLVIK